MKVVDANVLAYYFLECQYTPLARRLFEMDSEWGSVAVVMVNHRMSALE